MKNKGFTLIELLAVIVILAIIALIAVPTILNIINDARIESKKRSIDLYGKSIELAIARKSLTEEVPIGSYKTSGNTLTLNDSDFSFEVEYDGEKVECDTVKIYDDGTVSLDECKVDGQYVDYAYGIYTDNSGANPPELVDGLIPVIYDDNIKQWKIANIGEKWYDYDKKEWANAVILSETGKNKKVGDILNLPTSPTDASNSDVKAMFVWIPRYEYKMPETVEDKNNPDLIDINFISKDVSKETDGYILHSGFTFGSDTLSGIWVGKFETTGSAETPTILPNQTSLKNQSVSLQFETAKKFNAQLNNKLNSHMAKNSEWGAVAYLSYSKYGKDGEVYINNCNQYITGIGADSANAPASGTTCTTDKNKYNGESGKNASTTGNEYGVYDMSGGAWEYVMGYLTTAHGSKPWGSTSSDNYSGFTDETKPDDKYFNAYTTTNADDYKGQALGETKGWHGNTSNFVSLGTPWFHRGGDYTGTSLAGVFDFGYDRGGASGRISFRVVLTPTV